MQDSKKLVFLAQIFISAFMAILMTGIMGFMHAAFSENWLVEWGMSFLTAWPVAFVLSMIVGPLSFRIAMFILRHMPQATPES
ncbi:DUF2798 domain-containing protein [Roseibium litorale]|uniref:DUF2798 domain-containing protein n=1 Tax=Roseibium litorale TaxID=2803841 RepID=A0ABR9CHR6_9HYPH|nr:DUF2798 domain-containing protein [Roseibium litorale]MBD8890376.1 DUF2798 domain-containing protein [Roseibium litorale]